MKKTKQYSIEVEADPFSVYLDDFKEADILDYVTDTLGYFVFDEPAPPTSVLDKAVEQMKDEFCEGLDFHQLHKLVKNKDKVVELLTVLP